jgi:hypothetical protein
MGRNYLEQRTGLAGHADGVAYEALQIFFAAFTVVA